MTDLFEKIEMPLIRVLCDMETAGIAVDVKFLEEFSARMEKEIAALTIKIHKTGRRRVQHQFPQAAGGDPF
jgi:DNA polymerase-1